MLSSTQEYITNLSKNLDEFFKCREPRCFSSGCSNLNFELHLAESIQSYIENGGSLEKNFIKEVFTSALTRSDNPSFFGATVEDNPVIKLLIDKINLDIPVDSHPGEKIIHLASRLGKTKIVEALLDRGVNIDKKTDKGKTPLDLAIELHREKTIKFLIERGANVNAKTIEGETPLHPASKSCEVSIAQDLINAKAENPIEGAKAQQEPGVAEEPYDRSKKLKPNSEVTIGVVNNSDSRGAKLSKPESKGSGERP